MAAAPNPSAATSSLAFSTDGNETVAAAELPKTPDKHDNDDDDARRVCLICGNEDDAQYDGEKCLVCKNGPAVFSSPFGSPERVQPGQEGGISVKQ